MSAVASGAEPRSVSTEITYLAPGSFINRRYVSPGVEVNTGTYRTYPVTIRDGRGLEDRFTLDSHGFTLARHESAVTSFLEREQVDALYAQEVVALVRQLTGADLVYPQGWMVRTSGERVRQQEKVVGYVHQGGVQPPAGEAHVDFTPRCAERIAADYYRKAFPEAGPYRRFMATSLWRAFSPPPQDWPLALCDGSTVTEAEEASNTLVVVDEIPDRKTMMAPIPGEDDAIAATIFRHSPAHRWWYFSNMTPDEVVLLKFYDSDHRVAWRTPHTAFHDTSFPDARVRESIEFRTIAYFLDG